MKLYYSPGACSLSPHIVLRELGYDFSIEKVDLGTHKTESGADFTAINPKGYVPAIDSGNGSELMTEGAVIVQWLADQKPAAGLMPAAGTPARYRAQEMLNFIASEFHKVMGGLFERGLPEERRAIIMKRLTARLAYVESVLAKRPYLLGDSYSVADAYAFTVLSWAPYVKVDLSPYPHIQAYAAKIAARPAVQAALKAEGLV